MRVTSHPEAPVERCANPLCGKAIPYDQRDVITISQPKADAPEDMKYTSQAQNYWWCCDVECVRQWATIASYQSWAAAR